MKVEQLSIFLENTIGRLAEVAKILAEAEINIRALAIADTADFGVLRILVDDVEKAKKILREKGFTVGETDVVGVEVPDQPGGLYQILVCLEKENVNVEYMYAFVNQSKGNAVMIFRFDQLDRAVDILSDNGFRVIPGSELYNL
ncbi:MAG: amino acid-binding protein [Deltaproteobacteria bacterium]|nr:MAG: amino acid-binding protein [Deltaproteobacteria bacterium]